MKKIAIIGLGGFGINLATALAKTDIEIIAIDSDENKVNQIKDLVTKPVTLDATNKENLISVGIQDVDCAVVASGPALEPSIITVHILKELGVPQIFAKALSLEHEKILSLVGATEVLYPERDVAKKLANQIISPNLIDFIPLESGLIIQEIAPPDAFIGKTLEQIHLRKKYNITVIAIKSIIPDELILNPGGDHLVKESDILIVLGVAEDIANLHEKIK
ncbi:MAG: TrkA family potassium uptake protein [Candidatus Aminicenantes bacterium]|nr:TrkA family potassium uptake protein [Candidatus Aminicenantes bacterium]